MLHKAIRELYKNVVVIYGDTVEDVIAKDFNDKDYLLLIGDPSMIGLACSVAADYNRGRYKVLKYDRRSFTYYPIQIDINERNNYDRQS